MKWTTEDSVSSGEDGETSESTSDSSGSKKNDIDALFKQACLDSSDNSKAKHSPFYQTALDDAVHNNDIKLVKRLFFDFSIEDKKMALCRATQQNKIDIAKFLLTGISTQINTSDDEGLTLLHHAVQKKDITLVSLLIKHDYIQVNETSVLGRTPLHYAVKIEKHAHVAKRLFAFDDITEVAGTNKYTDIINLLLAHPDILVNARDGYRLTPLHCATLSNHPEAVQLLLKHPNIQIHKTDTKGQTALQIAQKKKYAEIILLLSAAHSNKK